MARNQKDSWHFGTPQVTRDVAGSRVQLPSGRKARSLGRIGSRRLRTFHAPKPNPDMIFTMVFTVPRQPCLTILIQIFGEP
ncbi:hypothetical protein [Streptomyces sp. NPDC054804]